MFLGLFLFQLLLLLIVFLFELLELLLLSLIRLLPSSIVSILLLNLLLLLDLLLLDFLALLVLSRVELFELLLMPLLDSRVHVIGHVIGIVWPVRGRTVVVGSRISAVRRLVVVCRSVYFPIARVRWRRNAWHNRAIVVLRVAGVDLRIAGIRR